MTLLTVEDFREHVTTELGDDAVQRLLDSAEAAIVRYAGPSGMAVEVFDGGRRFYTLDKPAEFIDSITEERGTTSTDLAADDFYLYPSGLVVERMPNGTTYPFWYTNPPVRVTIAYTAKDDEAIRIGVQLDLVQLALNSNPGATAETIGAWSEQKGQTPQASEDAYWSILSRLDVGPAMLVVG